MKRKMIAGAAMLLAQGCAGLVEAPLTPATATAERRAERVVVKSDADLGVIRMSGPVVSERNHDWLLRGLRRQGGGAWRYQVYVEVYSHDWLFIESAWDDGRRLSMREIDSDVLRCSAGAFGRCVINETVGVSLSQRDFDEAVRRGIGFKLVGRRGSVFVYAPAEYFRGIRAGMSRLAGG